jgi:hypothetical protein
LRRARVGDELAAAWQASADAAQALAAPVEEAKDLPDQYLMLITCRNESHQTELLGRLHGEGWSARRCCRRSRQGGEGPSAGLCLQRIKSKGHR